MPDAELVHTCTISAQACPLVEAGSGPKRTRVVANVRSLSVTSEQLNARFATNDAADWLTIANGCAGLLDVQFTLETDHGAFIYVEC